MKERNKLPLLFILLFIAGPVYFTFSQQSVLRNEIDKILRFDTDIDFKKTPGFIIAVIDNDSTYYLSFGTKVEKEKIEFNRNDIFEIGSITKVFTSSLISILMNEGKIKESDCINDNIPAEFRNPRLGHLTISDLLNHQTGMPKRPSFFGRKEKVMQNPYAYYSEKDLLEFYRDFIPDTKTFEYSHTNYALLEVVIASVTSKNYQDILSDKIINPLGMASTFVDFPESKSNFISPGYDRSGKKVLPWSFKSFKGSEGVKTSAEDMVTFLKANMKMSGTGLDSIFDNNFGRNEFRSFNDQLSVSMGWHNINKNHFNIVMHTGMTSGHSAFVGMVRETKTAVVIFANSSLGTQDLGLQILRLINYNWKRINS